MNISMFEYGKIILHKVRFDKDLFNKELSKAIRQFRISSGQ